jgi:hypothetical protein
MEHESAPKEANKANPSGLRFIHSVVWAVTSGVVTAAVKAAAHRLVKDFMRVAFQAARSRAYDPWSRDPPNFAPAP